MDMMEWLLIASRRGKCPALFRWGNKRSPIGDPELQDYFQLSMIPEFQHDGLRSNRDDDFIDRTTLFEPDKPLSAEGKRSSISLDWGTDQVLSARATKPFFIGASWWTFLLLWVVFESFGFELPASHLELWAVLFILLVLFCSQPQVSYPESRVVPPCFQVVLLQAEDLSSLGRSLHIFEPYCSQTTGLLSRCSSPLFDFLMF